MNGRNVYNVGIGKYIVSSDPKGVITTFALSTCVAVIVYDSINKVGGLIHIALPDSGINPVKAKEFPGYYADTGLDVFMRKLSETGAARGFMDIYLVGGASLYIKKNDIAERNITAIRNYFTKQGLKIKASQLGGSKIRTVYFYLNNGTVKIKDIKVTQI